MEIGNSTAARRRLFASLPRCLAAFSLVEMMIAIVILGLGLIMVATMFPVAWDRARKLNEGSLSPNVTANARINLSSLLHCASLTRAAPPPSNTVQPVWALGYGSFAGDLFYDSTMNNASKASYRTHLSILSYSDSRVHALNVENMLISHPGTGSAIVAENPWITEYVAPAASQHKVDFCGVNFRSGGDPEFVPWEPPDASVTYRNLMKQQHDLACGTLAPSGYAGGRMFVSPQIKFEDRIHPAMPSLPDPNDPNYATLKPQWDETLATRRYAWAILHRLRPRTEGMVCWQNPNGPQPICAPGRLCAPIGPTQPGYAWSPACLGPAYAPSMANWPSAAGVPVPNNSAATPQSQFLASEAAMAMGSARNFDIYYVMLRRPSPTYRYAQQDASDLNHVPNPDDRSAAPIVPSAQNAQSDVAFPVPWRVQVEFPKDLPSAFDRTPPRLPPTGAPVEITVPPQKMGGGPDAKLMVIQMFPQGTLFVDEVTGVVYRVVKQRIAATGDSATLTLDKEVLAEDLDDGAIFRMPGGNPQVQLDPDETIRTVWVFPPSVEPGRADGSPPTFSGGSPAVSIDVDGLTFVPAP
ncbi:MAG: prepilin-type N-terminal cleavage/methylation domain-containing protein [Planctomycetes bacterium]|nr:prepilin-type N-terminal cleavage/methylation domain-containing protein [Planctomycetota bacterium]MBI3832776.1 prepilin-type N-terminal cleavage/methylation domain-containing protein [Planctomycetota bacterium]